MQWFTGNIGLHHIHHASSRIPNYHLQRCYDENPELRQATRLGLFQSVKTLGFTLWDEDSRQLIGFRILKRIRPRLEADGPVEPTKPEAVPASWK
jgi:omega-6 fatty acid desaturase (delta-12 desaturase)